MLAHVTNLDALYMTILYYDQWFTYNTSANSYTSICYNVVIIFKTVDLLQDILMFTGTIGFIPFHRFIIMHDIFA